MKIALVCPSNILYMPYVDNYTNILDEIDLEYDIINWDRFKIEKDSEFKYRDSKIGHQRSFLDYFKYSRFVLNILKKNNYDKVVVFGIQLVFFLKRHLIKEYRYRYIIDIRDYSRIIKYFNIEKTIEHSNFTVLSSPGYKEWLPKSNKYVINHNTQLSSIENLNESNRNLKSKEMISINYIGSIRDYKINVDFINSLKNSGSINLKYHGAGAINKDIESYLEFNSIKNVVFTGRYMREEEQNLYIKADIVNILIPTDTINSKTLLPNRLYNATIYGKPVIALKGTYLAKIVDENQLGLVLNSFDNIEETIIRYISNLNFDYYDRNRSAFLEGILEDNNLFKIRLTEFISN